MKLFSVPADFKENSVKKFREINDSKGEMVINETYGQVTEGRIIRSGRIKKLLPEIDMRGLEKYVNFSLKNGIKFNYTLNPACMGNYEFTKQGIEEIRSFLLELNSIGIRDITVTSPAIMEIVKTVDLDFDIKVSAINHVDSVSKLSHYKKLGIKRIVVEPDTYRNFSLLKNMVHFWGEGLELIVNDLCYKNCPYKISHYNHEAHSNDYKEQVQNYFFMRCGIQKSRNMRNYLKLNWIRPEDIDLYEKLGIHNYKIQGRGFVLNGDIMKTLECYQKKAFEGNLLELLHIFAPYDSKHQPYISNKKLDGFIDSFYSEKVVCDELCDQCGYCDLYAEKALEYSDALLSDAIKFYNSQDEFKKNVEKL